MQFNIVCIYKKIKKSHTDIELIAILVYNMKEFIKWEIYFFYDKRTI